MDASTVKHPFIPPAAVADLRRQASRLAALGHAKDRREWRFGWTVNDIWDSLPEDVQAEVSREMFFVECSRLINEAVRFPLVTETGETVRVWASVEKEFRDVAGLELMQERLSFDHFRVARSLYLHKKVSVPVYALAKAIEQEWTADDMKRHFDPPEPPDMFQRAVGWLDLLETYASQYANGKAAQIAVHVRAIRELLA
jgi:hypothetical protein